MLPAGSIWNDAKASTKVVAPVAREISDETTIRKGYAIPNVTSETTHAPRGFLQNLCISAEAPPAPHANEPTIAVTPVASVIVPSAPGSIVNTLFHEPRSPIAFDAAINRSTSMYGTAKKPMFVTV